MSFDVVSEGVVFKDFVASGFGDSFPKQTLITFWTKADTYVSDITMLTDLRRHLWI